MDDKNAHSRKFVQDLQEFEADISEAQKVGNFDLVDQIKQKRHEKVMEHTTGDQIKQKAVNEQKRQIDHDDHEI